METILAAMPDLKPRLTLALGKATRAAVPGSTIEVAVLLEFALIVAPILVDLDAQLEEDFLLQEVFRGPFAHRWRAA